MPGWRRPVDQSQRACCWPVVSRMTRGRASSHGWSEKNCFLKASSSYRSGVGENNLEGLYDLGLGGEMVWVVCAVLPLGSVVVRVWVSGWTVGCWRVMIWAGGTSWMTSTHMGRALGCSDFMLARARLRTRRAERLMRPMVGGRVRQW